MCCSLCTLSFLFSFSLMCIAYSANMNQILTDILGVHVCLYEIFTKSSFGFSTLKHFRSRGDKQLQMAFKGRWNFLLAADKAFCSSGCGKTQTLFSFRVKLFHLLQKLKLCNVIFLNFNKLNNLLVGCMRTYGKLCTIWPLKEMTPHPTFLTLLALGARPGTEC